MSQCEKEFVKSQKCHWGVSAIWERLLLVILDLVWSMVFLEEWASDSWLWPGRQTNSSMLGAVPVDGAEEWIAQFTGFARTH